jgi:hypothetical protein
MMNTWFVERGRQYGGIGFIFAINMELSAIGKCTYL